MSLELKPCPFCGGRAGFMSNAVDFQEVWGVSCDGECGAQIDSCAWDKEDAAEIWNQRSDAARQEGARGGEPVAWRHAMQLSGRSGKTAWFLTNSPDEAQLLREEGVDVQPLYASPAEPSGWRPIESAPRDETRILAWSQELGARETYWRFYGEGSQAREWFKRGEGPSGAWDWPEPHNNWSASWTPTHWMPLPLPPTSEGGGA